MTSNISCVDIYEEELNRSLKTLKRFREAWLRSSSGWNTELFQYADPDFYFYRFAIDRQEKNKEPLIIDILYRVMERYELRFSVPEDRKNVAFDFIIHTEDKSIGYTFTDFYADEDVNQIIEDCGADEAFIIRTWKHGRSDEWIKRENNHYTEEGLNLKAITIEDFFNEYFGETEFAAFEASVSHYLKDARDITGYQSIKFLSSMNLASQKAFEEKILAEWEYKSYKYQIIDRSNKKIQNYLYLDSDVFSDTDLEKMVENYIHEARYRSLVGGNEYAESFITSEWLYHSLKGRKNFDFTSVISGYLKSIEQLLYILVMLNVDNSCRISMSGANNIRNEAKRNGIVAYKQTKNGWVEVSSDTKGFIYIDLTVDQAKYMDSSIGTFEYFRRKNPHIFENSNLAETVADMVCCFRTECRNGYFHTHNLTDWDIVEKTRDNAIYLYFVLLGECLIAESKLSELKISSRDSFDELCKKIREFRHYNAEFIFEYEDGTRQKLIYDFINNTIEYTDDGMEHYASLLFYKVSEFSLEVYEKLDKGVEESQKLYLTRDSLPKKIYGIYRNGDEKEITF